MKHFDLAEVLNCFGVLIGAADCAQVGNQLLEKELELEVPAGDNNWVSLAPSAGFGQYVSLARFKAFRRVLPKIFVDEDLKDADPWWQFSSAIEDFNYIRSKFV